MKSLRSATDLHALVDIIMHYHDDDDDDDDERKKCAKYLIISQMFLYPILIKMPIECLTRTSSGKTSNIYCINMQSKDQK